MESENFPPLESFEGLIRYIAGRCASSKQDQEDLAQELRMKYDWCKIKCPDVRIFSKYYKTAMWNYGCTYAEKDKVRKKYECPLFENMEEKEEQRDVFTHEEETLVKEICSELSQKLEEMYSEGTLIELIREEKKKYKHRKMGRPMLIFVIAQALGISWREIAQALDLDKKVWVRQSLERMEMPALKEEYRKANALEFREYRRKYRKNHPEEVKESNRKYYQAKFQWFRNYYQENREKIREYQRQYYQENVEWFRDYYQVYYQNNEEQIREHQKRYCMENPEKRKESQEKYYQKKLEMN